MPHTPPPKGPIAPKTHSHTASGMPIRVKGKINKITIERPYFFDENVTGEEQVTANFSVRKISTSNRHGTSNLKYRSTAREIVVKIAGVEVLHKNINNGNFSVEIYFVHPRE